ncbi:asparaginyl-tRNA synthetase [Candidatus Blochmanniella floridana]|uniref:Asparagine--tRNA ligase n=1 Tax=Blochmanniella floridana TaxID=203907 RepID=SYN_BLOFL|nr:RecName: Full=Asparagine--tRNA ligase; AltName: Full=Asparaginyl-tRNA synthetase; Short=AsnRS [Candidatus Blochmannia floridanus]CAD83483.1 asparaginyl-tRNA synthetase [Candidatus Blochmannia floridanus]
MNTISIVKILNEFDQLQNTEITLYGWIRTRRHSKTKITFLNLYDGSCLESLQIVVKNNLHNYETDILKLTTGCSIIAKGYITNSLGTKQRIELIATYIQVLGWIDNPSTYPITTKKHSMEYLRNVAHLRPRTHIFGAISRIRHVLFQSIHNLMNTKGFIWVPTPIITASDTEGNSKMFYVSELLNNSKKSQNICNSHQKIPELFFGKEAFLTVSGQLNVESYACALTKVYTFGPTFRAEHSNTNRHLAEFWMLEPEMAFTDLNIIIKIADSLLKDIVQTILEQCINDIEYCASHIKEYNLIKRLENFLHSKIIHIEYTDAIKLLSSCDKTFNNTIYWGMDLFSEHEKYLSEEYFQSPIVIKNHPKNIKAFYMRLNDDNKTVSSMDILVPGIGEIIGGSQREERLSILDKRLLENNLKTECYWWYRDLRRYGTVPHSGFGLGFERLIIYITGLTNIRDAVPFPRTINSINF